MSDALFRKVWLILSRRPKTILVKRQLYAAMYGATLRTLHEMAKEGQ